MELYRVPMVETRLITFDVEAESVDDALERLDEYLCTHEGCERVECELGLQEPDWEVLSWVAERRTEEHCDSDMTILAKAE